jgi:hypothetical protein
LNAFITQAIGLNGLVLRATVEHVYRPTEREKGNLRGR